MTVTFDLKISSVHTYVQVHQNCQFGEILQSDLQNVMSTNFLYVRMDRQP